MTIFTLLKKILEDAANLAPRSPLDHEPSKKKARISFCKL